MTYRNYLFTLVFICLNGYAVAQTDSWKGFNQKRLDIQKIGMLTLGSWAVGNMAVSGFSIARTSGSTSYFHQMNVYWNVVNLTLAGLGYFGARNADPGSFGIVASVKEQFSIEKILLLNAGLDVAYIAGGLYLTERAKNAARRTDQLKGFGQSVMLQGGFLLVFDTVLFLVNNAHGNELGRLLSGVYFTGSSVGLVMRF